MLGQPLRLMGYKENYFIFHGLDKCDILYCANCPGVAVDLHHVKYKSQGGSDDPQNLCPLCFKCHSGHHDRNNPTTKTIKIKMQTYDFSPY